MLSDQFKEEIEAELHSTDLVGGGDIHLVHRDEHLFPQFLRGRQLQHYRSVYPIFCRVMVKLAQPDHQLREDQRSIGDRVLA